MPRPSYYKPAPRRNPMSRKIEPTITLPEAVGAVLFALEFPQLLENFYDIAFLLEQRPGAVRNIIKRINPNWSIGPVS